MKNLLQKIDFRHFPLFEIFAHMLSIILVMLYSEVCFSLLFDDLSKFKDPKNRWVNTSDISEMWAFWSLMEKKNKIRNEIDLKILFFFASVSLPFGRSYLHFASALFIWQYQAKMSTPAVVWHSLRCCRNVCKGEKSTVWKGKWI